MKTKYYQCTGCSYVYNQSEARCRCLKCNNAVLPYKDRIGVNIKDYKLVDGVLYLK